MQFHHGFLFRGPAEQAGEGKVRLLPSLSYASALSVGFDRSKQDGTLIGLIELIRTDFVDAAQTFHHLKSKLLCSDFALHLRKVIS